MRFADEQRSHGWRHHDWRTGFHPECAEARDHDRRVHRINPAAAGSIHCFAVVLDELRPAFVVCFGNHRCRESIAFEGYRNSQMEIFALDNTVVFQN